MNLYVIGNGKSRKDFDVNQLKAYGKVICCNLAFRDIDCDAVSTNHKHFRTIRSEVPNLSTITVENPNSTRKVLCLQYDENYSRYGYSVLGQMPNHLIDDNANPRDWNSGQVAIIAGIVKYKPTKVYLIGFDFFDIPNPKKHWQKQVSNNMYHNNHNERPQNIEKIYNWIVEEYPDIKFHRVGPLGDPILDNINMEKITYDEFNKHL